MNYLADSRPASTEGKLILAIFFARWVAGILENFGIPALSQGAAIGALGVLGTLFLYQMRIAADVTLFLSGLALWLVGGALSWAANPGLELRNTLALLSLLILYALFANASLIHLRNPRILRGLAFVLSAFVVVGCALSVWQLVSGTGFVENGKSTIQRAYGSDVHPVSFAIQLVAALVALEIVRIRRGRRFGVTHLGIFVLGGIALYLTYSRTAWMMAALILLGLILFRGSPLRRVILAMLGASVLVAALLATGRFADLSSLPTFLANFSMQDSVFDWRFVDNSISWRIVNWSLGLAQGLEQPLLGFGPGQSASSSYFSLEMHNIFLEAFFEGGGFGLLALLVSVAGLIRLHRRLPRRSSQDRYVRLLADGYGLSLLAAVTFSTSFVDQLMGFLIYLLLIAAAHAPGHPRSAQIPVTANPSSNRIILPYGKTV